MKLRRHMLRKLIMEGAGAGEPPKEGKTYVRAQGTTLVIDGKKYFIEPKINFRDRMTFEEERDDEMVPVKDLVNIYNNEGSVKDDAIIKKIIDKLNKEMSSFPNRLHSVEKIPAGLYGGKSRSRIKPEKKPGGDKDEGWSKSKQPPEMKQKWQELVKIDKDIANRFGSKGSYKEWQKWYMVSTKDKDAWKVLKKPKRKYLNKKETLDLLDILLKANKGTLEERLMRKWFNVL